MLQVISRDCTSVPLVVCCRLYHATVHPYQWSCGAGYITRLYVQATGRVLQVRSRYCTSVPVVVWCRLDHATVRMLVRFVVCTTVIRTFALHSFRMNTYGLIESTQFDQEEDGDTRTHEYGAVRNRPIPCCRSECATNGVTSESHTAPPHSCPLCFAALSRSAVESGQLSVSV